MTKSALHHGVAAITVAVVAFLLLATALHFTCEYGKAHQQIRDAIRAHSTWPLSISDVAGFRSLSRWYAIATCATAVIALVMAIRTKRRSWFACLIISAIFALLAELLTDVMF